MDLRNYNGDKMFESEYIELDLPKEIAAGRAHLRKAGKTGIDMYEMKLDIPYGNRVIPTKLVIPAKHIHATLSVTISPKAVYQSLL